MVLGSWRICTVPTRSPVIAPVNSGKLPLIVDVNATVWHPDCPAARLAALGSRLVGAAVGASTVQLLVTMESTAMAARREEDFMARSWRRAVYDRAFDGEDPGRFARIVLR